MKKFVYLTLIVLFAFILSSCAKATSQPVDEATLLCWLLTHPPGFLDS